MTDFIHAREFLHAGDIVLVNCTHQCNVLLMDDSNFNSYRRGSSFEYFGGLFKRFPARIAVPRNGNWNVALDIGGGRATIRYSIGYIRNS